MSETPAHRALAGLSLKHRETVRQAAAAAGVTETVWIESLIDQASGQIEETVGETVSETVTETVSQRRGGEARTSSLAEAGAAAGASLHRSHHAAVHLGSSDHARAQAAGRVGRDVEIEREVEVRSRVERHADGHAEHDHRTQRSVERPEFGVSDYHHRIAARAAAAEDVPVTIWLEQAILERTRLKHRSASEAPPSSPPPAQPQAAPSVEPPRAETVVLAGTTHDRSRDLGLLAAALLGAVLTALLFLTLAWMHSSCPLFVASTLQTASSGLILATLAPPATAAVSPGAPSSLPAAPQPGSPSSGSPTSAQFLDAAPPAANVSVTTIVDNSDSISDHRIWRRRARSRHAPRVVIERSDSSAYAAYAGCGCN